MNDYKQECFKRLEYTQKYSKYSEEDLVEEIIEKDKEIERLNKECDTYMKIATKKYNIINELEKWLNDNKNLLIHYDYESKYEYIYVDELLDKLKELKEKSDI